MRNASSRSVSSASTSRRRSFSVGFWIFRLPQISSVKVEATAFGGVVAVLLLLSQPVTATRSAIETRTVWYMRPRVIERLNSMALPLNLAQQRPTLDYGPLLVNCGGVSTEADHLSPLSKDVQLTMTRILESGLFPAGAATRNRDPSAVT